MKKYFLTQMLLLALVALNAQTTIDYYLPAGTQYNQNVPSPQSFFGFMPGTFHLSYDKLAAYIETLASKSDRVSLIKTGVTHEGNQMLMLVITSPANQQNLEKLRVDHLGNLDPASSPTAIRKDPLVVWMGYSVHGNEPSGGNAAPLLAYYLSASQDEEVRKMLDQTIVIIDPCLNPDGFNRFASWVNSRKSMTNNPDVNSIEFSEPWPGSRGNHYWFDLNRDWLWIQHPESQARIEQFHRWKPHILTDHHEMGSNSTFFFQPGVNSRSNPLVPPGNFSLTQKIGTYHARELDAIGSLYFTEEMFDDFYFGKGSAYPDLNGSIGILFEQASSRGHLRKTEYGVLSFPYTIRNQVLSSLSTLKASQELIKELKYNQIDFYRSAMNESSRFPLKGYIFGDQYDPYRAGMMADLLMKHQVRMQKLKRPALINGTTYLPESSWYVPLNQLQFRLIRTMFEEVTQFADSTFYDVSGWTLPHAMGISYAGIDEKNIIKINLDGFVSSVTPPTGSLIGNQSSVGYLFSSDHYLVHKAIYDLLSQGIRINVATESFLSQHDQQIKPFQPGTLFVPVQFQPVDGNTLYQKLSRIAESHGIEIHAVNSAYTMDGPDLGSGSFRQISMPRILCLAGEGLASREIGQIWHLLDVRFSIPVTLADVNRADQINLNEYNTLIMVSGSYSQLSAAFQDHLKSWVRDGGKIIALRSSSGFLNREGLLNLKSIRTDDPESRPTDISWANRNQNRIGRSIPGTIFATRLDTTHPLAFGYHHSTLAVFRTGSQFFEPSPTAFENIAVYENQSLISGYVSQEDLKTMAGTSAIQRQKTGQGAIVYFADDPIFRGYWAGQHKMLMNAIFWGNL